METALAFGMTPKGGHWESRAPNGQILKGRKHISYDKTVEGEKKAGYVIKKAANGRYYSFTPEEWKKIQRRTKDRYIKVMRSKNNE